MSRFTLNWHQDRELYDTEHFIICNIGGYGSGKSQVLPLAMRDRSKWDTSQRHGLFANSTTQVGEGIMSDVYDWLEKLGIEYVFGSRPPQEWVKLWRRLSIPFPQRGPRSPHTLILKTGFHLVCGGLANKAYKRFKGFRFGSIWIEEVTELQDAEPIGFLLPRCRCGDFGSGLCQATHRHQIYLHGNPPDPRQPHWIRDWVKRMCAEEKERLKNGEKPFFLYLRSSTYDNVEHVGYEYIDRLRKGLDPATAEAMITGSLESVQSNTTFDQWSKDNVCRVDYHPDRPLLVSMDFNVMPSATTFGHELHPDEVPERFRGSDQTYSGVFGEFAGFTRMTAAQTARTILEGDRSRGGHWPSNFQGLRAHRGPIFMYGDATGHMHRVEAEGTAWEQVNDILMPALGKKYYFEVEASNPTVFESSSMLNAKICNDAGERTYFVSPLASELIKDYEQVIPSNDGSTWIDKTVDRMRTHWVDPERYKVFKRYPGNRKNNLKSFKRDVAEHLTESALMKLGQIPTLGTRRL